MWNINHNSFDSTPKKIDFSLRVSISKGIWHTIILQICFFNWCQLIFTSLPMTKVSRKMLLIASCNKSWLCKSWLSTEDHGHCDRCSPHCALWMWKFSSFWYLYLSRNNQALINATGYDHQSIRKLLTLFTNYFTNWILMTIATYKQMS